MRYGVNAILPQYAGGRLRWMPTRWGTPIQAVVIHKMEGLLYGTDGWFRMYGSGVTSTHFGIGYMSWLDKAAGRVQVRQWVDTAHTAYGWRSRPNDTPTALARKVFGNHGLYNGGHDMNRNVIHIEVEGYAHLKWDPKFIPALRGLLAALGRAHGPLYIMGHTDLAAKACPGMSTTPWNSFGGYGSRIGIVTTAPATTITAGGLPVSFTSRYGWKGHIIRGKPRRSGATLASRNYGSTTRDEPFSIIAEVAGQNWGVGGRWFVGAQYINGWKWVYVPLVDLKNRNF